MAAVSTLTDQQFKTLIGKRDKDAFALLYDLYAAAIYGTIYNKVKEPIKADKILQDVFSYCWFNISEASSSPLRLFTWLLNLSKTFTQNALKEVDNTIDIPDTAFLKNDNHFPHSVQALQA